MKKIRLFFILLCLVFLTFTRPLIASFREDAGIGEEGGFWKKASEAINSDELNIISWSGWVFQSTSFHLVSFVFGYPNQDGTISPVSFEKSLIGKMVKAIDSLLTQKPVTSLEYLSYLKENFGIKVKQAYAQGQGWNFLGKSILPIWEIFRNIAYIFFILIFVITGFMIMFRRKLDSQTSISIQNSLPRIITALFLVTFSFALCGLIVDVAFLLNNIILHNILTPLYGIIPGGFGTFIKNVEPFTLIGHLFNMGTVNIGTILQNNLALGVILAIVILTSAFRIFLSLLSRYVMIVLISAASPLAFLMSALPGKGGGRWIRSLLAASLSFPAVYFLLNLAAFFIAASNKNLIILDTIVPFETNINIGLPTPTPGASPVPVPIPPVSNPAAQILAIGIILLTPNVPNMIDEALGVKQGGGEIAAGVGGALRRIPVVGALVG